MLKPPVADLRIERIPSEPPLLARTGANSLLPGVLFAFFRGYFVGSAEVLAGCALTDLQTAAAWVCSVPCMVLVIDNYDSFTYNLVQYLGELRVDLQVHRNDQISLEQIRALNPERILISPGPCSPRESGLSNDIIRAFSSHIPTLGVCLGHQCIGHTFGANVVVNYRIMHGKTSLIKHNGKDLFDGMPNPFAATRYHSLVIQRESLPECLKITAQTDEGEIMGIRHKQYPIWGVQFHPESILTENGRQILRNFLALQGTPA